MFFEDPSIRVGTRTIGSKLHKVKSFVIDYSALELEIKIQQLLQDKPIRFNFNLFILTDQMNEINKQYKLNIEQFPVIQQIINALFAKTWWFFCFQIVMYIFYIVPFLLQMLYYDHSVYDYSEEPPVLKYAY